MPVDIVTSRIEPVEEEDEEENATTTTTTTTRRRYHRVCRVWNALLLTWLLVYFVFFSGRYTFGIPHMTTVTQHIMWVLYMIVIVVTLLVLAVGMEVLCGSRFRRHRRTATQMAAWYLWGLASVEIFWQVHNLVALVLLAQEYYHDCQTHPQEHCHYVVEWQAIQEFLVAFWLPRLAWSCIVLVSAFVFYRQVKTNDEQVDDADEDNNNDIGVTPANLQEPLLANVAAAEEDPPSLGNNDVENPGGNNLQSPSESRPEQVNTRSVVGNSNEEESASGNNA